MVKSMTAYSRASVHSPLGRLVVEIHSVNRKMLDLSLSLPKELLRFDIPVRKQLGAVLERGQVTLRLTLQNEEGVSPLPLAHLKSLKLKWEEVCKELNYDPQKVLDLPFLVGQLHSVSPVESKEEEEATASAINQVVEGALQDLMQMKRREGQLLLSDIRQRLESIEAHLAAVELKKDAPLVHYQKKLVDRLKDVGPLQGEAEERVIREVALLAEKMDVTEELVRLKAHIAQFRHHFSLPDKAVGRTLDFLTQEMHREMNTLGSKSCDSEVSLSVVQMKGELDKIREQVQNIE